MGAGVVQQISHAVAEMDKIVQRVASSAEESAGASEEMNGQAQEMKAVVSELLLIVNGSSVANDRTKESEGIATKAHRSEPVGSKRRLALTITKSRGGD